MLHSPSRNSKQTFISGKESFQRTPVDIGGCEVDQGERAQEDQRWDWSELISSHQGEEVGEMPAEFQGYLLIRR